MSIDCFRITVAYGYKTYDSEGGSLFHPIVSETGEVQNTVNVDFMPPWKDEVDLVTIKSLDRLHKTLEKYMKHGV